ncbi:MAG: hypothetical protein LBU09_01895, partial [Endomicrobium sp.]|nr:hypothetical protein [Endomicrobium sp.]
YICRKSNDKKESTKQTATLRNSNSLHILYAIIIEPAAASRETKRNANNPSTNGLKTSGIRTLNGEVK